MMPAGLCLLAIAATMLPFVAGTDSSIGLTTALLDLKAGLCAAACLWLSAR